MHKLIIAVMTFMLAVMSGFAVEVSDGSGLALEVGPGGAITSVEMNGIVQPNGTAGGFYLMEPNSSTRVPMVGTISSNNWNVQSTALQATVQATVTEGDGYIEVAGELENLSGSDRGLWLGFNVPVNTLGWKWGQTLSTSPVITSQDTGYESSWDNTLVPIPSVWTPDGGIALCIPPSDPCVFQLASDADGLRIQMAFGLSQDTTKFPAKAPFRFRIYSIDGIWGFRDALAKYYDWYPEYYTIDDAAMTALDHHHDWITANYVPDSINIDDLVDPNSKEYMAYTKTSARLQGIANPELITTQQGFVDAIANATTIQHYEKNGNINSPLLVEGRAALHNSICYNLDQTFGVFSQAGDTIDFPHNCDPDLFKDAAHPDAPVYADMYLRRPDELLALSSDFASIHWDRLGGWSLFLNYRRDHFAYIDHPLTFDKNGQVCIYTQLTNYEMFDEFRLRAGQGGLFHEGAGMKDYAASKFPQSNQPAGQSRNGMFFLASLVAGGWQEGSFDAQPLGGFDFERMSVGRKSYRVSSGNIVAKGIPPTLALVKRALAQTTAYGFACPVQVQYFFSAARPGYLSNYSWYTLPDHKALWDQYEPANLAIRLAGWEPVTHAYSSSSTVQLQRFGKGQEVYLTVWGPNPATSVEIDVDTEGMGLIGTPLFSEIVANTPMTVVPSATGWTLTVPMETDMTRVIKIEATNPNITLYPLTVNSGTGSGSYTNGQQVAIAANAVTGMSFVQWSGDTQVVDNVTAPNALVTMSTNAVTLAATYVDAVQATIAVVDSTGGQTASSALPISQVFPITGGNVLVVNLSYKGVNNTYPEGPPTLDWVTSGGAVTQPMTRAVQTGTIATKAFSSSIYYLWNPILDTGGTISGALPAGYQQQVLSAYTLSGVDTNTSPIIATTVDNGSTLTITTDVTGVPAGGFAALCSANIANTAGTGFSASESGTGTTVNWFVNNVGGIGFYQGYIPELVATTTSFSCTFGGTANKGHMVAAVFSPGSTVVQSAYSVWSNQYSLVEGPTGHDDDDGLNNLYEFALGGNPTNDADLGYAPTHGLASGGGSNWLEYIHVRQTDPNSGLRYYLELCDNLVSNVWTTNGYSVAGSGPFTNGFDAVTNRISTESKSEQFIRLIIEQN